MGPSAKTVRIKITTYVRTLVVIAVLLVTEGIEGDEDVLVVTKKS